MRLLCVKKKKKQTQKKTTKRKPKKTEIVKGVIGLDKINYFRKKSHTLFIN